MKLFRQCIALLVAAAAMQPPASACAVCNGDPNPNMIAASNGVIGMLLGLVGFIFASSGFTILYLWWKSK